MYQSRISAFIIFVAILATFLCSPLPAQEGEKVAVLYFTDHSGFDSGDGCLSIWPLKAIFGSGGNNEQWNLKSGFRNMLNEELSKAGYVTISPEDVDKALREAGKENLSTLGSKLDTDFMIVGDITKFEQHRNRISSQGPTTLADTGTMTMVAMGGIGGFFYSSTVKTDVTIYDGSGEEMDSSEVSSKKNLRDFYMGVGPLTYHRDEEGSNIGTPDSKDDPIVDYKQLDKMEFGTEEFKNRTLFGITTLDVMGKIVARVKEYAEPAEPGDARGKIIYVGTGKRLKEDEVYINLGAGDGIEPGNRLVVYIEGLKLTDPDTGEELGAVEEEKIGVIEVSKVEADHLSLAKIIEKTGKIERGNLVKQE